MSRFILIFLETSDRILIQWKMAAGVVQPDYYLGKIRILSVITR